VAAFLLPQKDVDGARVRASWFRGELLATTALRTRADLLMRMRETFQIERGGLTVDAGLDEPLAAMLTRIRGCDHLVNASFGPFGEARGPLHYQGPAS
jgi:hypothetical protein